ncbi:unnamed protein product [Closterium sp. Yama58-4]|nr:unnamed protein product [Closterium sp. Yama58-4]
MLVSLDDSKKSGQLLGLREQQQATRSTSGCRGGALADSRWRRSANLPSHGTSGLQNRRHEDSDVIVGGVTNARDVTAAELGGALATREAWEESSKEAMTLGGMRVGGWSVKAKTPRRREKGALPKGALPKGALPKGALPKGALPKGALPKGALPKGALPKGALPKGALPKGALPKGALPKGALPKGALPKGALPKGALPKGALPKGALPKGALPKGALPKGALPKGALPKGALPKGALPKGALPKGALPKGALPKGALPKGALPKGALPKGALPKGALPKGALPKGALRSTHQNHTASYIVTRGFSRVCLQFPDSLLPHAVSVHDALRAECAALIASQHHGVNNGDSKSETRPESPPNTTAATNIEARQDQGSLRASDPPGGNHTGSKHHGSGFPGFTEEGQGGEHSEKAGDSAGHAADRSRRDLPHFYVLADAATATCSSCCVDEVSPCHVSADCIIHYGHACMSRRPARFPVRYVLPRQPIDVAACAAAIKAHFKSSSSTTTNSNMTANSGADSGGDSRTLAASRMVLVLFALEFAHAADDFARALGGSGGAEAAEALREGAGEGEEVRYVVAQVREREVEPEEGGKSGGADTCGAVSGGCCNGGARGGTDRSACCGGAMERGTCGEDNSSNAAADDGGTAASVAASSIHFSAAQCDAAQCAVPGTLFEHGGLRWVLPPGSSMAAETAKSSNPHNKEEAAPATTPPAVGLTAVVWVGSSECPSLITFALEHNQTPILRLDPTHLPPAAAATAAKAAAAATTTDSSSTSTTSKSPSTSPTLTPTTTAPLFHPVDHSCLLRRRYFLVEKTKDASIIGIVVISQSAGAAAAATRATLARLRSAAVAAGKKAYVIAIRRRITPEKLANFPECDVLVLVACAEGVLLDGMMQESSSKAFYAPVVTPFEALMALEEGREWTGEYRMLLDGAGLGAVRKGEEGGEGGGDVAPRFSFVKGSLVSPAPHKVLLSAPSAAPAAAAAAAAAASDQSLAVRQDMALSALPVSSDSLALAQASGQSGYATSAAVEAQSGSEFLALRRDYKGLEVPWFMAPGGAPGEGGGDARGRGDESKEGDEGGREDRGAVGAFMPKVAPAIDAVRVVEGREGRAAGYVDEPLQG